MLNWGHELKKKREKKKKSSGGKGRWAKNGRRPYGNSGCGSAMPTKGEKEIESCGYERKGGWGRGGATGGGGGWEVDGTGLREARKRRRNEYAEVLSKKKKKNKGRGSCVLKRKDSSVEACTYGVRVEKTDKTVAQNGCSRGGWLGVKEEKSPGTKRKPSLPLRTGLGEKRE